VRKPDNGWIKKAANASVIGLLPLVSIGVGLFIGLRIDSKLSTSPWFAFVFTLLGLAAGLYESVRILIEVTRDGG
jgi:F0F1-type ATP synthase assembly protein I